jgi:hypothetical protein
MDIIEVLYMQGIFMRSELNSADASTLDQITGRFDGLVTCQTSQASTRSRDPTVSPEP